MISGTFTGLGPGYFAASTPLLSSKEAFPECAFDKRYSGSLCSPEVRMVRMEWGSQNPFERRLDSVFSHGDHRMAPDCATGRYIHVGSYVQATECMYLRDKWFPKGEFFHVVMDPASATLTPYVTGHASWWSQATGQWDFSDPNRVTAEFYFEWDGCRIADVGIGTCNRTIKATFSVDGTQLL